MLFYSHIWDLLLKCLTIVSTSLIPLIVHDQIFGVNADVVIPIIAASIITTLVVYRPLVSVLSSWLYARLNLGVPVSFSDAKALRMLFQLSFGGTQPVGWYPMKEVKQLPADERRAALMTEVARIKSERRRMLI